MRAAFFLLVVLAGCAPPFGLDSGRGEQGRTTQLRMDVTCISAPDRGMIVTDCADRQTWKEYQEKKSGR